MNVKDLFSTWSNQKGFPLLTVNRNDDGTVTIQQQKYDAIYNPEGGDNTTLFSIPYNFASASSPKFDDTAPTGWLIEHHAVLESNGKWSNNDWIIFNLQQTGFYRVLYDDANYGLINKILNSNDYSKIHTINRAQYIDDLSEFVNSGRIKNKRLLFDALSYLKNENEYAPWVSAGRSIVQLHQIFQISKKFSHFQNLVADAVKPFYETHGVNKEFNATAGYFEKFSQKIAVNLACQFGNAQCLNETYTKFQKYFEFDVDSLSPDVRGVVFANGIRQATLDEVENLFSVFLFSESDDVRKEIIASLGNIQDAAITETFLNKVIDDVDTIERTKQSERLAIIQSILVGSQDGLSLTIKFLQNELIKVNATIGSVKTILTSCAGRVVNTTIAEDVIITQFFKNFLLSICFIDFFFKIHISYSSMRC